MYFFVIVIVGFQNYIQGYLYKLFHCKGLETKVNLAKYVIEEKPRNINEALTI